MSIYNGFILLVFMFCMDFFIVISEYSSIDDYNSIDIDRLSNNVSLQPSFDFGMPRNITSRVGQTAMLNCRVNQLGDKSVSWIRKRDLHILTAGIITYTSDGRFQVLRAEGSTDWVLQVKFAQVRDSGVYECQVNTEPKMSMAFQLNVVETSPEARATISGPAMLYVKVGSAITLTCLVKEVPHEIGPIHWYRDHYVITPFDVHPNDVSTDLSRRISMESQLGDSLKSRLKISNAQTSDSGNYTCLPTTAEGASVIVHVINGEHPAAMQRGGATSAYTESSSRIHIHITLLILITNFSIL